MYLREDPTSSYYLIYLTTFVLRQICSFWNFCCICIQSLSVINCFSVSSTYIAELTFHACVVRQLMFAVTMTQCWTIRTCMVKGKAVPLQVWSGPEVSRNLRFPVFMTTAKDAGKLVSLTHRPPLPPGNTPGTHFCQRLSRPQGDNATGRIMSLKNSNDTIRNRTCDLPVCSAVP